MAENERITPRCMACDEPESLCICATGGATALALKLTERGRDEAGRKITIHADDFLTLCQRAYAWANDASKAALSVQSETKEQMTAAEMAQALRHAAVVFHGRGYNGWSLDLQFYATQLESK